MKLAWTYTLRSDDIITKQTLQWTHLRVEEEDDPGTPGKWTWKKKCGWQASGTAGGRWR